MSSALNVSGKGAVIFVVVWGGGCVVCGGGFFFFFCLGPFTNKAADLLFTDLLATVDQPQEIAANLPVG